MMDTRIMAVGSAKLNRSGERRPRIRISGFWLEDMGFGPDSLVTVRFGEGSIEFRSQGKGVDVYNRVIGQVRKSRLELLQVRNELHNRKRVPHFEVKGLWLEEYGFVIGSILVVRYSLGHIDVKLLDMENLGI